MFARAFARVQQHVLDDGIRALAVLDDLLEIAAQHIRVSSLISLRRFSSSVHVFQGVLQLINQFARNPGEIVDEIERVLDLMRDAGGQLTKRGEFLRLDEAILRGSQILQRCGQFARAGLDTFEQGEHSRLQLPPGRRTW